MREVVYENFHKNHLNYSGHRADKDTQHTFVAKSRVYLQKIQKTTRHAYILRVVSKNKVGQFYLQVRNFIMQTMITNEIFGRFNQVLP